MLYKKVIRPILFALSSHDHERAHELTMHSLERLEHHPLLLRLVAWYYKANENPRPVNVCGITFPNRFGLAAGFDKNAGVLLALQAFGFGFVEIGSVLPDWQQGNPRPRVFRVPEYEGIINRMGFNSDGADAVRERLERVKTSLTIPIGISLGKMKETPLEEAATDYKKVLITLRAYASYFVINVSSPNTPELRKLQGKRYIENLVRDIVSTEKALALDENTRPKPEFVKIAPDLSEQEEDEVLEGCVHGGARGLIVGNTTIDRPLSSATPSFIEETGGLSGRFLQNRTCFKIRSFRAKTTLAIIGVGGIESPDAAMRMIDAGADLIQGYTGLIYHGPQLIKRIRATV